MIQGNTRYRPASLGLPDEVNLLDADCLHEFIDVIHHLRVVFLVIPVRFGVIGVPRTEFVDSLDMKVTGKILKVLFPVLGITRATCLPSMNQKQCISLSLFEVSRPDPVQVYIFGILISHS